MKNTKFCLALAAGCLMLLAACPPDGVMKREGKTTVIDTKTLTTNVRGFGGPTPLKIYIANNKVTRIETQANKETPEFFAKAKALLKHYEGLTVKKAQSLKPDAVTGATMSSRALMGNMQAGLKYYTDHKK